MAKWLDSGDLVPYEDQVGGHKFTKEKPLLGSYFKTYIVSFINILL